MRRLLFLLMAILFSAAAPLWAAPAPSGWFEGFEGPDPSWSEAGGDAPYVLQQHRRIAEGAHSGQRCEWLQLSVGQGGSSIYLAHDVGHPWVIEDLRPSVWLSSDRPGAQLIVEVVLPRTLDPRNGRPALIHLWGSSYTEVGHWQTLGIDSLPKLLARQVRMLRSQLRADVDDRDAYVSRVLLNIYGGPGITNVLIDDLALTGYVASGRSPDAQARRPGAAQSVSLTDSRAGQAAPAEVHLAGSMLLVQGRPMLPRAIQYQGEPLTLLKQLGFNTVWLRQVPAPEMLAEARRVGLWLVCPPPVAPPAMAGPSTAPTMIGPEFQAVLAWDLGTGLTAAQAEAHGRWAEAVRLADAAGCRPLVACPANDLREYSRQVNLLVIDRRPLGTSLEMPDYGVWVRRQPLLARLGTPIWTTVQTQPGEGLRRQLAALMPGWQPPAAFAPEQIRLLVLTAISCGSRGLVFQSQSPLSDNDPQTRQRAMTLELVNLELDLIEPWLAGGSFVALAQSNKSQVNGAVLRSDRARLILPAWLAPHSQCVSPEASAEPLAMIVPGVPESANAYELAAGRLEPLRRKRETGGTRVTLDEFHLTAMLLLAQDPLVIDAVSRRLAASGRSIAEIERQLASQQLDSVGRLVESFRRRLPATILVDPALATARQDLERADARLRVGDFPSAALEARRAMRPLRMIQRASWNAAMQGWTSPVASPGTATFATLPWHWALVDRLQGSQAGPNRLPGGDFEDLEVMLHSGWRHERHEVPGVRSAADLVPEAAYSGRQGLRLTARADDPENPPAMVETPPVWMTAPAVPVEAGQIVRIHGWVDIPSPITGSVDGLLVIDSLAGEDLAERIDKTAAVPVAKTAKGQDKTVERREKTTDWREFRMFRIAGESGPMTVSFVLTGLGEARLDDVSIQVMTPPGRPLPAWPGK